MAVVVVGGGGRGVGKTALVCGVIAALPERNWIAVKMASELHGADGPVWEESEPGEETDTARYLAAGARRAFLLTAADDATIKAALDGLWDRVERAANLIIESNRVLNYVNADLCLMGFDDREAEGSKESYELVARRADASVSSGDAGRHGEQARPVFRLEHFERLSPEMVVWIRGRLEPK